MPVGGIRGSHRRWRDTGMTVVYIYLIGGFAVMLLVILVTLTNDKYRSCTESVIADVVDSIEYPKSINHKHTTYDYSIRYSYDSSQYTGVVEGTTHVVKNDKISIDINPDNPSEFIESSKNGLNLMEIFLCVMLIYYSPVILMIFIVAVSLKGKDD